jgi:hypothetical protein
MRTLAVTDEALAPFWSPDSHHIAYFSHGKLKKIDVSGGPPQVLADSSEFIANGAWSRDGSILFLARDLVRHRWKPRKPPDTPVSI